MYSRMRLRLALAIMLVAISAGWLTAQGSAWSTHKRASGAAQVVVPKGHRVQIAFVGSRDYPDYTYAFRNAIQMAIEQHPAIRGFPIRVNESDPPCFSGPDPDAANVATATSIVDQAQNTAVIGHVCSSGFKPALPIYESAGVVTVSGSATETDLTGLAPTVFNRTAVQDPDFDAWYTLVSALPSDLAFQHDYETEFGSATMPFSDLYFDATNLLIRRLRQASRVDSHGDLVVDREALVRAVRNTVDFQGVSCSITFDASGNRENDPAALADCAQG